MYNFYIGLKFNMLSINALMLPYNQSYSDDLHLEQFSHLNKNGQGLLLFLFSTYEEHCQAGFLKKMYVLDFRFDI